VLQEGGVLKGSGATTPSHNLGPPPLPSREGWWPVLHLRCLHTIKREVVAGLT